MHVAAVLAAVAAVLGDGSVWFLDTDAGRIVGQVPLPGEGAALFAAPDGRVLVPLRDSDATVVAAAGGQGALWAGRIFPLFFDEVDRMYLVLPGELVAVSYPERVPLFRRPLGVAAGSWRASCSANGQVVAVVPADDRQRVVLLSPHDARFSGTVVMATPVVEAALAPDGTWLAVGLSGGKVQVVAATGGGAASLAVAGEIRGMALSRDAGTLVVAVAAGRVGTLVGLRVRGPGKPLKVRFTSPLDEAPSGVALTERDAVVVTPSAVVVVPLAGRKAPRRIPVPGGRAVTVLPAQPASVVPDWGDEREP